MLTTQLNGANFAGLGTLGASYNPADIAALQAALVKAGKGVRTDGVMDGNTLASTYELLRDKGGLTASVIASLVSSGAGSSIKSAFQTLQDLDKKLGNVPGVSLSIPSLLRDSSKVSAIVSVAQAACSVLGNSSACDVVNKIQNGLNTFMSTASSTASTLKSMVYLLVPGSAPGSTAGGQSMLLLQQIAPITAFLMPPSGTGTYPAGTIYAFSTKLAKYRIAIPKIMGGGFGIAQSGLFGDCVFGDCGLGAAATMTEVAPAATPPANGIPTTESDLEAKTGQLPFYKKWQFWTALGGGVAVIGTGTAFFMHRRKKVA